RNTLSRLEPRDSVRIDKAVFRDSVTTIHFAVMHDLAYNRYRLCCQRETTSATNTQTTRQAVSAMFRARPCLLDEVFCDPLADQGPQIVMIDADFFQDLDFECKIPLVMTKF